MRPAQGISARLEIPDATKRYERSFHRSVIKMILKIRMEGKNETCSLKLNFCNTNQCVLMFRFDCLRLTVQTDIVTATVHL